MSAVLQIFYSGCIIAEFLLTALVLKISDEWSVDLFSYFVILILYSGRPVKSKSDNGRDSIN
jgi:hypothetical protein